ncbi:MAG TPA: hypothetical protein VN700_03595 [Vicinamibacterales bacterium]|nr:hypothetical protein [Vicinamibacterales bacterium]
MVDPTGALQLFQADIGVLARGILGRIGASQQTAVVSQVLEDTTGLAGAEHRVDAIVPATGPPQTETCVHE